MSLEPKVLSDLEATSHKCEVRGCTGSLKILRREVHSVTAPPYKQGENVSLVLVCSQRPDLHRYRVYPKCFLPLPPVFKPTSWGAIRIKTPHWGFPDKVLKVKPHFSTVVK